MNQTNLNLPQLNPQFGQPSFLDTLRINSPTNAQQKQQNSRYNSNSIDTRNILATNIKKGKPTAIALKNLNSVQNVQTLNTL